MKEPTAIERKQLPNANNVRVINFDKSVALNSIIRTSDLIDSFIEHGPFETRYNSLSSDADIYLRRFDDVYSHSDNLLHRRFGDLRAATRRQAGSGTETLAVLSYNL